MSAFDTSIRDRALKKQRERLEQERRNLIDVVCETLRKNQKKYNIQTAYIVGSLLQPHRWYPFSDVDVALIGCSQHTLSLMKELEDATGKDVNVIELDRHPFPELCKKKGMKIYG